MSPQKSYGLKNIFLLVCILLPVFSSFAQEADVGTCTTLLLTHKFTERYSTMLRLECQTREMVTAVDMIYLRMQNRFKVLPWLQLELNGELNHRYLGNSQWRNMFRLQVGALGSITVGDVKFLTIQREYISLLYDNEPPNKHFFLSFYRLAYEPVNWRCTPFAHMYWLFGPSPFQRQLLLGCKIRLNKMSAIEVFCQHNAYYATGKTRFLPGISYVLSI